MLTNKIHSKQIAYISAIGIILSIIGLIIEMDFLISKVVDKISIEKEQGIAISVYQKIFLEDPDVVKDKKTLEEFSILVKKLTDNLPPSKYHYKFVIKKSDEVNAFATVGGYIIVNTALIKKANNAEELLGVLAHEIGHVNKRHILTGLTKQIGIYMIPIFILSDESGVIKYCGKNAQGLLRYKFSRGYEKEADIEALNYLNDAKINSDGLMKFLGKLQDNSIEFLSTHPINKNRVAYMQEYIKEKQISVYPAIGFDYETFKNQF